MPIPLQNLLVDLTLIQSDGDLTRQIEGVAYNSRSVKPGFLFVAIQGFQLDGHDFIPAALEQGATVIVYERDDWQTPAGQSCIELCRSHGATAIQVPNSRTSLSPLSAAWYDYPAHKLYVVGVTGTNGKTTTSTLISMLLDAGNHKTGLITTVDFKIGDHWWPNGTGQTTPEALEVQALLRDMVEQGCDYAIVESSSHALSPRWNRLGNCEYDIAVLTNVTHEHLDYHGSFEQYCLDKAYLFSLLSSSAKEKSLHGVAIYPRKVAIINLDDPHAAIFIEHAQHAEIITYGIENPNADVYATAIDVTRYGLSFKARTPWGDVDLHLKLLGPFNISNALAALSVALWQGIPVEVCKQALEVAVGVRGRMELIDAGQPFTVVVDYAHNPDSFEKIMSMMRPLTEGQMIVVFGLAGGRDPQNRPAQGMIAAHYCDFIILTEDDPRHEDPSVIADEIVLGLQRAGKQEGPDYVKIIDRTEAIRAAFQQARPGDIVLLLGKGHENCMIYADQKIPWNESKLARQLLQERGYQK